MPRETAGSHGPYRGVCTIIAMGKFKIKDALDLRAGKTFRLGDVDATATPGFDGSKSDLEDRFERYDDELYDLQERLLPMVGRMPIMHPHY